MFHATLEHPRPFTLLMGILTATAIGFPSLLLGQSVGERVRVKIADGGTRIGTVASKNQAGFDLSLPRGGSLSVLYSDIERLERSDGIRTYAKRYATVGFVIGAVPGALLGLVAANVCVDLTCDPSAADQLAAMGVGSVLLGGPGGLLGMAIGASKRGEKWESIPTPSMGGRILPMIDVALGGADRRAVLGARIRF